MGVVLVNQIGHTEAMIAGYQRVAAELKEYSEVMDEFTIRLHEQGITLRYSPTVEVELVEVETKGFKVMSPHKTNIKWTGHVRTSMIGPSKVFSFETLAEVVAFFNKHLNPGQLT